MFLLSCDSVDDTARAVDYQLDFVNDFRYALGNIDHLLLVDSVDIKVSTATVSTVLVPVIASSSILY